MEENLIYCKYHSQTGSQARDCTMRPGYHYGVYVQPARGYQVIRFQGHQSSIAVHIMTETEEIIHLP